MALFKHKFTHARTAATEDERMALLGEIADRLDGVVRQGFVDGVAPDADGRAFEIKRETSKAGELSTYVRLERGKTRAVITVITASKTPADGETEMPVTITVTAFTEAERILYGTFGTIIGVTGIVLGIAGVIPIPIFGGSIIAAVIYGAIGAGLGYLVGRPLRPLLIGKHVAANLDLGKRVADAVRDALAAGMSAPTATAPPPTASSEVG